MLVFETFKKIKLLKTSFELNLLMMIRFQTSKYASKDFEGYFFIYLNAEISVTLFRDRPYFS